MYHDNDLATVQQPPCNISLARNPAAVFRASRRIHNGVPSGQVPAKTEINWPSCAGARPARERSVYDLHFRFTCNFLWLMIFFNLAVVMKHGEINYIAQWMFAAVFVRPLYIFVGWHVICIFIMKRLVIFHYDSYQNWYISWRNRHNNWLKL